MEGTPKPHVAKDHDAGIAQKIGTEMEQMKIICQIVVTKIMSRRISYMILKAPLLDLTVGRYHAKTIMDTT